MVRGMQSNGNSSSLLYPLPYPYPPLLRSKHYFSSSSLNSSAFQYRMSCCCLFYCYFPLLSVIALGLQGRRGKKCFLSIYVLFLTTTTTNSIFLPFKKKKKKSFLHCSNKFPRSFNNKNNNKFSLPRDKETKQKQTPSLFLTTKQIKGKVTKEIYLTTNRQGH